MIIGEGFWRYFENSWYNIWPSVLSNQTKPSSNLLPENWQIFQLKIEVGWILVHILKAEKWDTTIHSRYVVAPPAGGLEFEFCCIYGIIRSLSYWSTDCLGGFEYAGSNSQLIGSVEVGIQIRNNYCGSTPQKINLIDGESVCMVQVVTHQDAICWL